jgi:hypothetical protein
MAPVISSPSTAVMNITARHPRPAETGEAKGFGEARDADASVQHVRDDDYDHAGDSKADEELGTDRNDGEVPQHFLFVAR